jgi:hypothetical protein
VEPLGTKPEILGRALLKSRLRISRQTVRFGDYGIVGVGHGEFLQSGGIEVLKKLREQKVSLLTSTITAKTRELKTSGL